MFKRTKNIDTAFRHIRLFSIVFLLVTSVVCAFVCFQGYELAKQSQRRIFILANGKALEAYAADRKDNIPVEARDHVKMFHHFFFTMDPDDRVIQSHINKALYLADRTAKVQYDDLKENGYYTSLVSGNISQVIQADSISVDLSRYPYYFRYRGTQQITRPSTIVTRSLVTEGYLRNVTRSDNNPHGFLIERWKTLENEDINIEYRQ